jgi:hypothetical protein
MRESKRTSKQRERKVDFIFKLWGGLNRTGGRLERERDRGREREK